MTRDPLVQEMGSLPETMKRLVAQLLHRTWPERPEHFCRNNGCQLGYLAHVQRTYREHLAEVIAERDELRRRLAVLEGQA